jgi:hypothetical protein
VGRLFVMVGEVEVSGFNRTNNLPKGEGQIGPLMRITNLVRRPPLPSRVRR